MFDPYSRGCQTIRTFCSWSIVFHSCVHDLMQNLIPLYFWHWTFFWVNQYKVYSANVMAKNRGFFNSYYLFDVFLFIKFTLITTRLIIIPFNKFFFSLSLTINLLLPHFSGWYFSLSLPLLFLFVFKKFTSIN